MAQKTSALTLRRINAEEIIKIGVELTNLRMKDEPYTVEYSLWPDQLWEFACALRILVRANPLALDKLTLGRLEEVFGHVFEHYRERNATAICEYLASDL